MKRFGPVMVVVLVAMILTGCGKENPDDKPLVFYVGGTMQPAMAELVKVYEARTGQKVEIDKSGSGVLLTRIRTNKSADVFICHDPFLDQLMEGKKEQLGDDAWLVSQITPVIVVQPGNPHNIKTIGDLANKGVKVAVTDLEYSTCGHMLATMFAKDGVEIVQEDKRVFLKKGDFEKDIVTYRSGGRTCDTVKNRKFDAAIVWDAVAYLRGKAVEVIPIGRHLPVPGVDTITSASGKARDIGRIGVTLATLKCSKRPEAAGKFAEFIVSDEGQKVFREYGFTDIGPAVKMYEDGKKVEGSVKLYAGAGLRKGVDELVKVFAKQSNARVDVEYGGSGPMMSRAKLQKDGDLFMPGDVGWVDQLHGDSGIVEDRKLVAYFVPVIIVQKGNPRKILRLEDLFGKGLTIALGNEYCQVGKASIKILKKNGLDINDIPPKRLMRSKTVNELGLFVKTGRADAAIVWDAIAINNAERLDTIEIPRQRNLISRVVIGMLSTGSNKTAAREFVDFITGPIGQKILTRYGYSTSEP
jgi:molybdate transport system substrate-binding protein